MLGEVEEERGKRGGEWEQRERGGGAGTRGKETEWRVAGAPWRRRPGAQMEAVNATVGKSPWGRD